MNLKRKSFADLNNGELSKTRHRMPLVVPYHALHFKILLRFRWVLTCY